MNSFRSERLVYRALETPEHDAYLLERNNDIEALANSYPGLLKPASKSNVEDTKKFYDSCLLMVVICLPPSSEVDKPTPIGDITLSKAPPVFSHHRRSDIGLGILPAYQGKGYGTEAIEWILEWGFQKAGLHRIGIGAFGFNKRALALYERLGFVPEGRKRDFWWYDGGWHDAVELAMLEGEWRAKRDRKLLEVQDDKNQAGTEVEQTRNDV